MKKGLKVFLTAAIVLSAVACSTANDKETKTKETKEKIVEKYKTQLEIYKRALEQALNRKVDKVVLCLANANWEEVLVF